MSYYNLTQHFETIEVVKNFGHFWPLNLVRNAVFVHFWPRSFRPKLMVRNTLFVRFWPRLFWPFGQKCRGQKCSGQKRGSPFTAAHNSIGYQKDITYMFILKQSWIIINNKHIHMTVKTGIQKLPFWIFIAAKMSCLLMLKQALKACNVWTVLFYNYFSNIKSVIITLSASAKHFLYQGIVL